MHRISSKTKVNVIQSAKERFFNNSEGRIRTDKGYLPPTLMESIRAVVDTKSVVALSINVGMCMLLARDYMLDTWKNTKARKLKKKEIRKKIGSDWAALIDFWNVEGLIRKSNLSQSPFLKVICQEV